MPKTDSITQARLKELLEYDPETGLFVWLRKPNRRIRIGSIAGNLDKNGYITIGIDGVKYRAHRLAFLYMLGWMPDEVDHDDHVRTNNRWDNLNPATNAINMKNQDLPRNNTSGHCGVYWNKQRGKWQAQIKVNGKTIHLGRFTDKSDAIATRQAADIKYGFHQNHGMAKSGNQAGLGAR